MNDFKFRRTIHSCEKAIDARHRNILQFRFAALPALEDRQRCSTFGLTSQPRHLGAAATFNLYVEHQGAS